MAALSDIDCLTRELQNKSVVFFAGSGISYDSGLVDVLDVLSRTVNTLLPSLSDEQKEEIQKIQPELFYSILLESCHGDPRCMNMWKCLDPNQWTHDYTPLPNLVHCFVAAYSYCAGLPVFTVNYDTMFEDACTALGISSFEVRTEPPPFPETDPHPLRICKLHGYVALTPEGAVDLSAFKTTMTEISKYNKPWLDYLTFCMERSHICFIGYSGRDIDFYPHMRNFLKRPGVPYPFWMMGETSVARRNETFLNADAIERTRIIRGYPSSIFPGMREAVFKNSPFYTPMMALPSEPYKRLIAEKGPFLDTIKAHMDIVPINPELFWILFCQRKGYNDKAAEAISNFSQDLSSLKKWERGLFLNAKMMTAREHARFRQYREAARALLFPALLLRAKEPEDYLRIMDASLQLVSAGAMDIPAHLYFPIPLRYRRYGRILGVRLRYALLNAAFRGLCKRQARKYGYFEEMAGGIVQEARIRTLAIDVRLCQALPEEKLKNIQMHAESKNRYLAYGPKILLRGMLLWKNRCINRLKLLQNEASAAGNYITATSVSKYLGRLLPDIDYRVDIERAVSMTSDISTASISLRDRGDFEEGLAEAVRNGNTLNVVKNLLGLAHKKYMAGKAGGQPLLSPDQEALLFANMRDVESEPLAKAFAYICRQYFGREAVCEGGHLVISGSHFKA